MQYLWLIAIPLLIFLLFAALFVGYVMCKDFSCRARKDLLPILGAIYLAFVLCVAFVALPADWHERRWGWVGLHCVAILWFTPLGMRRITRYLSW